MDELRSGTVHWYHVPVMWGLIQILGNNLGANTQAQIEDAVTWVKSEAPDALKILPKTGFVVIVRRGLPHTFLAIKESVQIPDRSRLEDRNCALAVIDEKFSELGELCIDIGEQNPFRQAFLELANNLKGRWKSWLEWRMTRRRQPTPEWLLAIRAERRMRKRSHRARLLSE